MSDSLGGQWLSEYAPGDASQVIVDLDETIDALRGSGRIFFEDGSPGVVCELNLPRNFVEVESDIPLYWMPPGQGTYVNVHRIREMFPEHEFPETANIRIRYEDEKLHIRWSTSVETTGEIELGREERSSDSKISAKHYTWDEFRKFALSNTAGSFVFRGQPAPYKLRTAFHRTFRKDLIRYVAEDIPTAHRQLSARTAHVFDVEKPLQRAAFWNLLQHHGYPTPLLDWTYSPFVAAFFAYRRRKPDEDDTQSVRILAFDKAKWMAHFPQLDIVNFARPHFSFLEALAIENPRAIPQQAISTLTNLDDIEAYIRRLEDMSGEQYLHAINLDARLRPHVMAELSLMGITAGSLFPGLDGACEELMGRFFHHQVPPLAAS